MDYLSEELPVYQCKTCLRAGRVQEWVDGLCCEECGEEVKHSHDEKAVWWSIGVYSTGRSYGGPEEGGWWYDTGSLIDPQKQRVFENFEEAKQYQLALRDAYEHERDVAVRGFTEKLPVAGYPARRPVYC